MGLSSAGKQFPNWLLACAMAVIANTFTRARWRDHCANVKPASQSEIARVGSVMRSVDREYPGRIANHGQKIGTDGPCLVDAD